jgi:hypothetical protein
MSQNPFTIPQISDVMASPYWNDVECLALRNETRRRQIEKKLRKFNGIIARNMEKYEILCREVIPIMCYLTVAKEVQSQIMNAHQHREQVKKQKLLLKLQYEAQAKQLSASPMAAIPMATVAQNTVSDHQLSQSLAQISISEVKHGSVVSTARMKLYDLDGKFDTHPLDISKSLTSFYDDILGEHYKKNGLSPDAYSLALFLGEVDMPSKWSIIGSTFPYKPAEPTDPPCYDTRLPYYSNTIGEYFKHKNIQPQSITIIPNVNPMVGGAKGRKKKKQYEAKASLQHKSRKLKWALNLAPRYDPSSPSYTGTSIFPSLLDTYVCIVECLLCCTEPKPLTENVWLGESDSERSGDDSEYAYGSDGYEDEEEWDSGIFTSLSF